MREGNIISSEKGWLGDLIGCLLLLSCSSICQASDPNEDILKRIIAGVEHNDSLISNLSFDYTVVRTVSEEWRSHRLERILGRQPELPKTLRPPTLEHTIRTGAGRFRGKKMYETSNIIAVSDGKVFQNNIMNYDGNNFTKLNLLNNRATISRRERLPLSYDVRKYALWFADGEPLHSYLTDSRAIYAVKGMEKVEGVTCYVVEKMRTFLTPDYRQETSRSTCWIAPEKGFLVKKAIVFSIKSPEKVLTITKCNLTEVAEGIWYYSNINFESYPLFLSKPDIIVAVELRNVAVNQQLGEKAFTVFFPSGCFVNDKVAGKKYTVGEE